jgi:hypothetical protein
MRRNVEDTLIFFNIRCLQEKLKSLYEQADTAIPILSLKNYSQNMANKSVTPEK